MNEQHKDPTPQEVSATHANLVSDHKHAVEWQDLKKSRHDSWDFGTDTEDEEVAATHLEKASEETEAATKRLRNFAELHGAKLQTAALAEAALDGVQINHPDAIAINKK